MTLRNVAIEMTDLFAGQGAHARAAKGQEQRDRAESLGEESSLPAKRNGKVFVKLLDFAPFVNVTLYAFLERFLVQIGETVETLEATQQHAAELQRNTQKEDKAEGRVGGDRPARRLRQRRGIPARRGRKRIRHGDDEGRHVGGCVGAGCAAKGAAG